MTNNTGRSLELYFIDGKPDGMLTAEVFNWTGHVLVTPRTQISQALARKEARYTGIYLLFGETDGEPLAYVGEGEDIAERIRNHDARKDWWTKAVLVTTGANNLNKAHVKYLEARLIEEAQSIGRVPLDNGNNPARPGLSEAAQANMEGFLDYLFIVLPAIGIDMIVRRTRATAKRKDYTECPTCTTDDAAPVVFETRVKKHNIKATAKLENGEFVVQAGSLARKAWMGQGAHNYKKQFDELVRAGILVEQGEHRVFSESYAFTSPSAAGAIVTGRSCNGQQAWGVRGTSETYQAWEQRKLAERE
ncbi:MAG: GIY-YIG nuclease family protein [Kiritimatiellia bacterium]